MNAKILLIKIRKQVKNRIIESKKWHGRTAERNQFGQALLPVIILVALLAFNVFVLGMMPWGINQFILIDWGSCRCHVGISKQGELYSMIEAVGVNFKSTTGAILILLMVGALAGTWLLSGIIPAMIYYGLQILHPVFFTCLHCHLCNYSLATGSSWTTSATVGIALIGIGRALGIPVGMVAGAVISGAYFGDKLSPLSDTTNLAPAMAVLICLRIFVTWPIPPFRA